MFPNRLMPDQVEFLLLSFEGPDLYSTAGGLGVRVTHLAQCMASQGFRTHLLFVGDPNLPGRESRLENRLQLYRWCQWISRYHPLGVYDGEEGKVADFTQSVPEYVIEHIARPAVMQDRHLVVMAEEWHTAFALIRLSDLLHQAGLRAHSILLWNANNTKGFERIDWQRLGFVATLTTVSRYMKQVMQSYGMDPLVIPNGIPAELLAPVPHAAACQVRSTLAGADELLLFKVARYDPDKCWTAAVEAAALLKKNGTSIRFLCRGGIEAYSWQVLSHATELGLLVKDVEGQPQSWDEALQAIRLAGPADLYNLRFNMPQDMLRVFYAAADFVLANSKHEPFGLVGLEAMAAGGVVITGSTGETYSSDGVGAISLDTGEAGELFLTLDFLRNFPKRMQAIRQAAPRVAARYTWENALSILFEKILLSGERQMTLPFPPSKYELPKPVPQNVLSILNYSAADAKMPAYL